MYTQLLNSSFQQKMSAKLNSNWASYKCLANRRSSFDPHVLCKQFECLSHGPKLNKALFVYCPNVVPCRPEKVQMSCPCRPQNQSKCRAHVGLRNSPNVVPMSASGVLLCSVSASCRAHIFWMSGRQSQCRGWHSLCRGRLSQCRGRHLVSASMSGLNRLHVSLTISYGRRHYALGHCNQLMLWDRAGIGNNSLLEIEIL